MHLVVLDAYSVLALLSTCRPCSIKQTRDSTDIRVSDKFVRKFTCICYRTKKTFHVEIERTCLRPRKELEDSPRTSRRFIVDMQTYITDLSHRFPIILAMEFDSNSSISMYIVLETANIDFQVP